MRCASRHRQLVGDFVFAFLLCFFSFLRSFFRRLFVLTVALLSFDFAARVSALELANERNLPRQCPICGRRGAGVEVVVVVGGVGVVVVVRKRRRRRWRVNEPLNGASGRLFLFYGECRIPVETEIFFARKPPSSSFFLYFKSISLNDGPFSVEFFFYFDN